jgi:hypothetical protein
MLSKVFITALGFALVILALPIDFRTSSRVWAISDVLFYLSITVSLVALVGLAVVPI